MPRLNQVLGLGSVVALASYPILVFWGLQHWSPRHVSLVAGLVLLLTFWRRVYAARVRTRVHAGPSAAHPESSASSTGLARPGTASRVAAFSWRLPVMVGVVLCGVAFAMNRESSLLFLPVAINSGMLVMFGWTLIKPPTMVEQFAVMLAGSISAEERRYCRAVTWVWTMFFAVNIVVATGTALYASRQMWAIYNGLVAYVLIGLVFTVELVYRHWRFRRYIGLPTDVFFRRIFPPRPDAPSDHHRHRHP